MGPERLCMTQPAGAQPGRGGSGVPAGRGRAGCSGWRGS